ncbi:MAG: PAS domain S-box protein [Bacteroidales bacterium]|nr:PAS domain S-box protein [Bacteroidales bacterium]
MRNELEDTVFKRTEELEKMYHHTKQSEDQFRDAFETAMQGMALISFNGSFLKVNTAICDMLGYQEEGMLKTDLQCITHPDDYTFDKLNMEKLKSGSINSYQLEKRLYHMEGLTAWVLQNMKIVLNDHGEPMLFVAQFIDITERKQAEDQLKKYSETLTVLLREVNHRVKIILLL